MCPSRQRITCEASNLHAATRRDVTAQAIMGVSMGRDIKAFGRGVVGGRSSAYEEEVAKGVRDALKELEDAAAALGADAVVALDLDYAEVGKHMLMVAASGTAVKLG